MGLSESTEQKESIDVHPAILNEDTSETDKYAPDVLEPQTHFSLFELKLLKYAFDKKVDSEERAFFDVEDIRHETSSGKFLLNSLFSAMDNHGDGVIDFGDYAKTCSITMRGTIDEKLKFSFKFFDNDKDGFIKKEDLQVLLKHLLEVDEITKEEYNSRLQLLDKFFLENEKMSFEEYSKTREPILLEGLGVFKFYFGGLLNAVEEISKNESKFYNIEGFLGRKNESIFEYLEGEWPQSYFVIRGGLLYEYKKKGDEKPIQIIPIVSLKIGIIEHDYLKHVPYVFKIEVPEANNIYLQASNEKEMKKWMTSTLIQTLEFLGGNRYNAFAPIRRNVNCYWYVNGKPWFQRLADVLEQAQESIFLTCWFISPQVYLRRNVPPRLEDRFDMILKKRAEAGVKIYMIFWNETKLAQPGLNSEYAKNYFTSLHPNFHIMRHPVALPIVWAHHQKLIVVDQEYAFHGGLDVCWGRWDDENHEVKDECHTCMTWPGKDYFNPTLLGTEDVEHPFRDNIDRTKVPRMPWHDAQVELTGWGARDVSDNFIERWNLSREDMINSEFNMINRQKLEKELPIIEKKTTPPSNRIWNACPKIRHNNVKLKNVPKGDSNTLLHESIEDDYNTCSVQTVRSLSRWSGTHFQESSIYTAYMDAIRKAEHYIFLENQYFISNTAGFGVQNRVAEAILDKVRWAIKNKKNFKVYLLLPITPDGDYKKSCTVRYIMYWLFMTLSRGGLSILETLQKEFPSVNISDYIVVYGMRKYDKIGENYVAEQVYTHSKLMIVDDRVAIIGSANINDRSFLGDRDSELATVVEDEAKIKIKMDGKDYMASRFAFTLRMFIMNEMMGYNVDDMETLQDPVSKEVYYDILMKTAINNEAIYRQVFPYIPSDNIKCYADIRDKIDQWEVDEKHLEKLKEVKGLIVSYPLGLLRDESLYPTFKDVGSRYLKNSVYQ